MWWSQHKGLRSLARKFSDLLCRPRRSAAQYVSRSHRQQRQLRTNQLSVDHVIGAVPQPTASCDPPLDTAQKPDEARKMEGGMILLGIDPGIHGGFAIVAV